MSTYVDEVSKPVESARAGILDYLKKRASGSTPGELVRHLRKSRGLQEAEIREAISRLLAEDDVTLSPELKITRRQR